MLDFKCVERGLALRVLRSSRADDTNLPRWSGLDPFNIFVAVLGDMNIGLVTSRTLR